MSADRPERILPRTHLILGGDVCRPELLGRLAELRPGCRIFNHYGPSETTVGVLTGEYRVDANATGIALERPLANVEVFVLDSAMQVVPPGVSGEIFVSGNCLAEGYIGSPSLSDERFIDYEIEGSRKRLYRTGDKARRLCDGSIEIVGRMDDQVKIRGYRIEPAEVASVLERHAGIDSAAVVAHRNVDTGSTTLVAYVVAKEAQQLKVDELRAFTAEHLPDYMGLAEILILNHLPLTANGKLDRLALPKPTEQVCSSSAAPQSEREQLLAVAWERALGRKITGIGDNFFELGGDSILAIQIASQLFRHGYRIHPSDFYRYPTIASAAVKMEQVTDAKPEGGLEEAASGPFGLTPIQNRFFLAVPEEFQNHWNLAIRLEFDSGVSASDVQAAFSFLVTRHEALRLKFSCDESVWVQEPGEPYEVPFKFLSKEQGQDQEGLTELHKELDLSTGRLLQLAWIQSERPELLVIVHHLAVDAVSWAILLDELAIILEHQGAGEIDFGLTSTSFGNWARHLSSAVLEADLEDSRDYWTLGASVEGIRLPNDIDGLQEEQTEGAADSVTVKLDVATTNDLLHKLKHVRVDELLIAALSKTLNTWSGEPALLLELEGHGRDPLFDKLDLTRSVGWFTSRYPVWVEVEGSTDDQIIRSVKEQLRQIPDKGNSYGVLRYLDPEHGEDLQFASKPQVSFNYLGQWDHLSFKGAPFQLSSGPKGLERAYNCPRLFAIEVEAMVTGGQLQFEWIFSPCLHRRSTIESLAEACMDVLAGLVQHVAQAGEEIIAASDFPDAGMNENRFKDLLLQLEMPQAAIPGRGMIHRDHSRLALSLFEELSQPTGHDRSGQMGWRNKRSVHTASQSLVCLQEYGERTPLIYVHPTGGSIDCYSELVDRLGVGQPFYALQDTSLSRGGYASIEEMAKVYVNEVLEALPDGPYILGGWSMGGVIAFEMAQQLLARNKRVEMLIVIDSILPDATGQLVQSLTQLSATSKSFAFGESTTSLERGQVDDRGERGRGKSPGASRDWQAVFEHHVGLLQKYRAKTYPRTVTLIQASAGTLPNQSLEGLNGWGQVAKVDVIPLPADHMNILAPAEVDATAETVNAIVSRFEALFSLSRGFSLLLGSN